MKLPIAKKNDDFKAPFYIRMAARMIVKWMNKRHATYEISGHFNASGHPEIDKWLYDNHRSDIHEGVDMTIDAWPSSVFHWILRVGGHDVSVSQTEDWLMNQK